MSYAVIFVYESPVELQNSVLFVDVSSSYLGGMGQDFASIPCDITSDGTDIKNIIITDLDIVFTCFSVVRDVSKYNPKFFTDRATRTLQTVVVLQNPGICF